jgi:hypothetical protein
MVDVDAADDETAVLTRPVLVERGRDPARDCEPDREAERREHRPLAPWAEMVVEMEASLQLTGDLAFDLAELRHAAIVAALRRSSAHVTRRTPNSVLHRIEGTRSMFRGRRGMDSEWSQV